MKQYPVHKIIPQIKDSLSDGNNLILTADPGAGKSTIVPLELLDEWWLGKGKILILQPRRVAAIAVARRMSWLSQTKPGDLVGHQVRFSKNISDRTRIEVLTEGILTRRIQSDPFLEGISLIIFDEFHERSIHSDLCLALCREIQKDVRPDLRIMVMSATLDTKEMEAYFESSRTVQSEGFLYPVQISHVSPPTTFYKFDGMLDCFKQILSSSSVKESYLVFLPGSAEISFFAAQLKEVARHHEILPLHGSLPVEEQERVLVSSGKPRIVLATNIAETSLTIEGITTVVDSGFCRKMILESDTGLERLELCRISRASARQRAGRAGRLGPGRAFRLWNKIEHDTLDEFDQPEIHRIDLSGILLELAGWGVCQPENFSWFEAPSIERIKDAQRILRNLLAVDSMGRITDLGKEMLSLPISPRLARMLLFAQGKGAGRLAAMAAAIVSEKDFLLPLNNSMGSVANSDLFARLDYFNGKTQLQQNFKMDKRQATRIERVAQQLFSCLKVDKSDKAKRNNQAESIARALLVAFPDRVCQSHSGENKYSYKICSGQGLRMISGCNLAGEKLLLALKLDSRLRKGSNAGKIFMAIKLEQNWLMEELNELCHIKREISFSEKRKAVSVKNVTRYGDLVIKESEDSLRDEELAEASKLLFDHARLDIKKALNLDSPKNRLFLNRLRVLVECNSDPGFVPINEEWLWGCLENSFIGCVSFSQLQKRSVAELYFAQLPYDFKQKFEKYVPETICVPSGSQIKIEYPDEGAPFLRVKIQEMFGMNESPTICGERLRLIIHFLSPAARPVQITSDLNSFWQNGYKVVVAELRGRYPKHPWPEDPARGVAFAGTRKQLEKKFKKT